MKFILLILGILLIIFSIFSLGSYAFDEVLMTEFDKGYVVGKSIYLVAGIVLVFFGLKKRKSD